jgi:hypothetical protein
MPDDHQKKHGDEENSDQRYDVRPTAWREGADVEGGLGPLQAQRCRRRNRGHVSGEIGERSVDLWLMPVTMGTLSGTWPATR